MHGVYEKKNALEMVASFLKTHRVFKATTSILFLGVNKGVMLENSLI